MIKIFDFQVSILDAFTGYPPKNLLLIVNWVILVDKRTFHWPWLVDEQVIFDWLWLVEQQFSRFFLWLDLSGWYHCDPSSQPSNALWPPTPNRNEVAPPTTIATWASRGWGAVTAVSSEQQKYHLPSSHFILPPSPPRLRCHPEVISDHPKSNAHGVFPDHNYRVWVLVPDGNSLIRGQFRMGMVVFKRVVSTNFCVNKLIFSFLH